MTSSPGWSAADLRRLLSAGRFDRYTAAAGGSAADAALLYGWNVQLAGAWHETLGLFEVVLRNALDRQLSTYHQHVLSGNGHWCADARMPWRSPKLAAQIADARRRARIGRRGPEVHGKIVAELTFGFWRYILASTYQTTLWSPALRHAFPHHRTRDRAAVYDPVNHLHLLRNRVAHHEPIHTLDHAALHDELLRVAGWIDPAAAAWITTASRIPTVLRTRP